MKRTEVRIGKTFYRELLEEARKRGLSPDGYLEAVIEIDRIRSEVIEPAGEAGAGDGAGMPGVLSVSERHRRLLEREAEEIGRGIGEAAESVIGRSVHKLPERPLTRKMLDAVVRAWGGIPEWKEGPGSSGKAAGS